MRQATRYDDRDRMRLGLPSLATDEDRAKAVEVSGEKTDVYKVEASKLFDVAYENVTQQMRHAAKSANFHAYYR